MIGFQPISSIEVWNEINQLNRSKSTSGKVPIDTVKSISGSCLEYLLFFANQIFANSTFSDKLELAGVSAIFMSGGGGGFYKNIFRLISVILAISKIFEGLMSKYIWSFPKVFFYFLYGFRNRDSTEETLFRLTEMCGKALADKRVVEIPFEGI